MSQRREERVPLKLETLVWGVQRDGQVFSERAHTVDISPTGACLKGLSRPVLPGMMLHVQHGSAHGRFRVVWIGAPGTPREGLVGLRCMEIGQATPQTLLYVDDQEHERERRTAALAAAGYRVMAVGSAREAIQRLQGNSVALVVLDHPLSDASTLDVVRFLRKHRPEVRVLITSAYPGTVPEPALALADRFLHKGAARARFVAAVEELAGPVSRVNWPVTRRAHRFPLAVPVEIRVLRAGVVSTFQARSTDLSEAGVGVMVSAELAPGEMVSVRFSLPASAEPLQVRGTVRRRDLNQYGIEFTTLTSEQRQRIRAVGEYLPPLATPHGEHQPGSQAAWR